MAPASVLGFLSFLVEAKEHWFWNRMYNRASRAGVSALAIYSVAVNIPGSTLLGHAKGSGGCEIQI